MVLVRIITALALMAFTIGHTAAMAAVGPSEAGQSILTNHGNHIGHDDHHGSNRHGDGHAHAHDCCLGMNGHCFSIVPDQTLFGLWFLDAGEARLAVHSSVLGGRAVEADPPPPRVLI